MGRSLKIIPTNISGVNTIVSQLFSDKRGAFSRLFCEKELKDILGRRHIVQVNHSCTHLIGTVRGIHYQKPPYAEMKFIRCLRGRVWDVALDLRKGSQTFLQWHGEELCPDSNNMIVIPEGCAHGFQVLEPDSELFYLHTAFYTPESEGAVRFDEPGAAVKWPLPISELSARDECHAYLTDAFQGIDV